MIGPPGAGKSLAAAQVPSILPPLGAGRGARGGADRQRLRAARTALRGGPSFGRRTTRSARRAWSAAATRPGPARRRSPTAASSSSTSSASSAATPWRRCVRRWRPGAVTIARGGQPGGSCPAASCWSPRPIPVRAAAARPTRSAAARRSPCSATRARLSGALADRIDILAAIRQPSAEEIGGEPGEASAAVRGRVSAARERQERRLGPGRCNAEMTPRRGARVRARTRPPRHCSPSAYSRRRLSGRAHDRVAAPGADGRRPCRRRDDRARADGPGAAAAEEGLRVSPDRAPARECLRRSWLLAHSAPTSRRSRPGRRARARRSCCASPTRIWPRPRRRRSPASPRRRSRPCPSALRGRAPRRGVLGLLPPRRALPGRPARRGRRALGADRPRRPGAARRLAPEGW